MGPVADLIRDVLRNSGNIVALGGLSVMRDTGLNGVRAEHMAYEIEEKYGYSNDEIISSMFFSRRVETFYDYYKNVILNVNDPQPTDVHKSLLKLQNDGKLTAVITRTVYSLYRKAGCSNVIEMHGSVEDNRCPVCSKAFGSEYIRHSKKIPLCDQCQVPLRPGFILLGELIDNGRMTESSNLVGNANVLLLIGTSLRAPICQHLIKYYNGNRLIVINTEKNLGDERADYRIYGNLCEIMKYVTNY